MALPGSPEPFHATRRPLCLGALAMLALASTALDAQSTQSGTRSLARTSDAGVSRFSEEIHAADVDGDRVRITGQVKTDAAAAGAVALWVRVEGDGGLLYLDRSLVRRAASDGEWTSWAIEAPLADAARRVSFGGELRAPGRAWFDAFAIEPVRTDTLPPPSAAARRYVDSALVIIEANSVHRDRIDWPTLRRAVMQQARGAATIDESYLAVRFALGSLGDGHSYFMAPQQMQTLASRPVANARTGREPIAPRGDVLAPELGYLALPGFAGGRQIDQAAFAEEVQGIIAALESAGVCRWIVDLRENSGGNLWPMLAGIGPLLGDGEIGASVDPGGARTALWYREGRAGLGEFVQLRVRGDAYRLRGAAAPVAVIHGPSTASAAEVLTIAFSARPATRSFGRATRGAVTATRVFPLADDAALVLAVASTSDRWGRVYAGPIEPDETIDAGARGRGLPEQPVIQAARRWLEARACG